MVYCLQRRRMEDEWVEGQKKRPQDLISRFGLHLLVVHNRFNCFEIAPVDDVSVELSTFRMRSRYEQYCPGSRSRA